MKPLKSSEIFSVLLVIFGLLLLSGSLYGAWAGKAIYFLTEISILVVVIVFIKLRGLSVKALLRWRYISSKNWVWILILSVSSAILLDEVDKILIFIGVTPVEFLEKVSVGYRTESVSDMFWLMLGVGFTAPWVEESIFRGFIQATLESKYSIPIAIILTSILFALIHMQPYWFIQLIALSLITGFCSWKFHSIIPSVAIHSANNIWTLIMINDLIPNFKNIYSPNDHVILVILFPATFVFAYSLYKLRDDK